MSSLETNADAEGEEKVAIAVIEMTANKQKESQYYLLTCMHLFSVQPVEQS